MDRTAPTGNGTQSNKRKSKTSTKDGAPAGRFAKRNKLYDARTIAAQPSDAAFKDGELDLQAFVNAREFEIRALETSMQKTKAVRATRAFQVVPRLMRRRTASHNVKRVPKRLRVRARREMVADATPTVEARRRRPRTTRGRIRAETAKRLGILAEKKRKKLLREAAQKEAESGGGGTAAAVTSGAGPSACPPPAKPTVHTRPARPKLRRDRLNDPPQAKAKFKKRQTNNKTWLPTHLWHAKRAKMTEPQTPLWRFALPLTPNEKCYRPTHRAAGNKGVVFWDTSYMSTIGLYGLAEGIEHVLRALGLNQKSIWGNRGGKWRAGSRTWSGTLTKAWKKKSRRVIGPATVIWNPESLSEVGKETAETAETAETVEMVGTAGSARPKRQQRQVLIRTHPSCFLELFHELLKLVKLQTPRLYIEDLRFEIGSIELTGPASAEALVGVLHPYYTEVGAEERHASIFKSLAGVTNSFSLPKDALLAFSAADPRLRYPPKKISVANSEQSVLLDTLAQWPVDEKLKPYGLFDRDARFRASRLPSQKAISHRKRLGRPGEELRITDHDPPIPIMLMALRSGAEEGSAQGTWSLLAPWACILPIWYSLMHFPLSSGGNPSFGGLDELRQVAFERGVPWFPCDFPATDAGADWELEQRAKRKREWDRHPKGKRVEWSSLDLGAGRKGEIGDGLACDFERLLGLPMPLPQAGTESVETATSVQGGFDDDKHDDAMDVDRAQGVGAADVTDAATEVPTHSTLGIINHMDKSSFQALLTSASGAKDAPPHSLITVRLRCVARGVAKSCARIYRLPSQASATATRPTDDEVQVPATFAMSATPNPGALPPDLRDQWLSQLFPNRQQRDQKTTSRPSSGNKMQNGQQFRRQRPAPQTPTTAPPPPPRASMSQRLLVEMEAEKQLLADSLLDGGSIKEQPWPPRPAAAATTNRTDMGDGHPLCPGEEDLIGFVTTGAFSLSEGQGVAVGSLSAVKVLETLPAARADVAGGGGGAKEGRFCVVRNVGENVGWLARWELV